MKKWVKKHKKICVGLVAAFIIVLLPIIVNGFMSISCEWAAKESNDWIGFWGAYLGAIGSFVMALIAYRTMQKNDEQLEYIKKQNRPYLYASIRKVIQQKGASRGDADNSERLYVTHTYYLSVLNCGNTIAKEVKIDIENSSSDTSLERQLSSAISRIKEASFFIPPKTEKNFVLLIYSNNPDFTQEQLKEQNLLYDAFEESTFKIKISYDWDYGMDIYEDSLPVKETTTDATSIVQMLDYIDNSIIKLGENVKAINTSQKN